MNLKVWPDQMFQDVNANNNGGGWENSFFFGFK